jgi:hypothetical protein
VAATVVVLTGEADGIRPAWAALSGQRADIYRAARWSASGTHRGAGLGIPPSKRRVSFRGMSWIVFANGRIVKGWDSWNLGQLFAQLTTPEP